MHARECANSIIITELQLDSAVLLASITMRPPSAPD